MHNIKLQSSAPNLAGIQALACSQRTANTHPALNKRAMMLQQQCMKFEIFCSRLAH
jgi:hypothetical protein